MKFYLIVGLSLFSMLGAQLTFADDSGADTSILAMKQDPSFVGNYHGNSFLQGADLSLLNQQYVDRSHDYEQRKINGTATPNDEFIYSNDMGGAGAMSRSMNATLQGARSGAMGHNIEQAQKDGEISQPLVVAGGIASIAKGSAVPIQLGGDSRATYSTDLIHQHEQVALISPVMNAKVDVYLRNSAQDPTQPMNPDLAVERCKASVSKKLAFQVDSSVTYGSTSNSFKTTISRRVFVEHLSASMGMILPAGANNTASASEVTGGLSYGIHF